MKPLADCRLYAFVDTTYLRGRAPELVAQQLCDGGADLIQLRAKTSTPDEIRRMAEAILPVTRRANVGLVINDHLDIARETGAEFCHLGQEDFFDAGYKNVSELKGRDGSPSRPSDFGRGGALGGHALLSNARKVRTACPEYYHRSAQSCVSCVLPLYSHGVVKCRLQARIRVAKGPAG